MLLQKVNNFLKSACISWIDDNLIKIAIDASFAKYISKGIPDSFKDITLSIQMNRNKNTRTTSVVVSGDYELVTRVATLANEQFSSFKFFHCIQSMC